MERKGTKDPREVLGKLDTSSLLMESRTLENIYVKKLIFCKTLTSIPPLQLLIEPSFDLSKSLKVKSSEVLSRFGDGNDLLRLRETTFF